MRSKMEVEHALIARYLDIVRLEDLGVLAAEQEDLAGLFVSSVSNEYLDSNRRVMIVGKETRSWIGGLRKVENFQDVETYIRHAMQRHAAYVQNPQTKSKFFQFYKEASRKMAGKTPALPGAVIWANLFCLSYKTQSPIRAIGQFERIKNLSRELLRAQIEVLKPDVIFFVTGASYDKYIKEFFKITEGRAIVKKSLWSFKADGIPCYRTTHPQWEKGRADRSQALALALSTVEFPDNEKS